MLSGLGSTCFTGVLVTIMAKQLRRLVKYGDLPEGKRRKLLPDTPPPKPKRRIPFIDLCYEADDCADHSALLAVGRARLLAIEAGDTLEALEKHEPDYRKIISRKIHPCGPDGRYMPAKRACQRIYWHNPGEGHLMF